MHKLLIDYRFAHSTDEKAENARQISQEIKKASDNDTASFGILSDLDKFPELVGANLIDLFKLLQKIHQYSDCYLVFSLINSKGMIEALVKNRNDLDVTEVLCDFFSCVTKNKNWGWLVLVEFFPEVEKFHPAHSIMKSCICEALKESYQPEDFDCDNTCERIVYRRFYEQG